jgi:uncharacterized protein (DUF952 family)
LNTQNRARFIYHIANHKDWNEAIESGSYRVSSLASEGFVHCSTAEQLMEVADRLFSGRKDVVVLEIHPDSLPVEVKYELAPNGKAYPHVFGEIPLQAVRRVLALNWENRTLEDLTA